MSAQQSTVERELEHEIEGELDETTEIATLSEREENRYQLQEIARRTVEPGLLKLKVASVSMTDSGNAYAINVAHPMKDGTIPIYADKPTEGWSDDYKIVRMLKWVGESGTKDPHALEFHDLYLRKDEDSRENPHDWYVVQPPDYTKPLSEQLPETWRRIKSLRPSQTNTKMYGFLFVGAIAGTLMSGAVSFGLGALGSVVVSMIMFAAFTILGMVVLDK